MKAFIATIFAICVLTTSVSAQNGTTASCTEIINKLNDYLPSFYDTGNMIYSANAMTRELSQDFDNQAYEVAQALEEGCRGLASTEVTTIAESILTSTDGCKKSAGEFVNGAVQGAASVTEAPSGIWQGLFGYATTCHA